MENALEISLVVPVFNEGKSLDILIESIKSQKRPPTEIIFVDGGSTDATVSILEKAIEGNGKIKLVKMVKSMPGEGRNIGVINATYDWIAFTDGGIKLHDNWLKELEKKVLLNKSVSFVFGNYSPFVETFFEKCASIAYVPPLRKHLIRGKFIASSLLNKDIWKKIRGFPNWRAAEDLYFIEKMEKSGCQVDFAPDALVYWRLRPDLLSTYRRFDLYSMYNVWVGRQAHWHYGVLRHYLLMFAFCLLGIFHHWTWFLGVPAWMLARSVKRIYQHRHEFGIQTLFNPAVIFMVTLITLVTDMATFSGWIKALIRPNPLRM